MITKEKQLRMNGQSTSSKLKKLLTCSELTQLLQLIQRTRTGYISLRLAAGSAYTQTECGTSILFPYNHDLQYWHTQLWCQHSKHDDLAWNCCRQRVWRNRILSFEIFWHDKFCSQEAGHLLWQLFWTEQKLYSHVSVAILDKDW